MTSSINGSTPPAKLNFALKVNLAFRYNNNRYVCNNVTLGQGHTGNNNNWWIFANIDSSKYPAQSVISGAIILDCVDQTDDYEQPLYIKAAGNSSFKVAGIVTSQVPTKQVTANQLCFQGLQLESFTNSQIDVTSGQLYSNVINVDSSSNCLTVYADRKKSSSVKDWAQDEMEQFSVWNKYNMASNPSAGLDRVPSELNFAIHGDLTFMYGGDNYVCSNLTFGQGNGSGANNWWLFSNINSDGKLSVGDVVISCTDTSTKRSSQTTLTLTPVSDDLFQL